MSVKEKRLDKLDKAQAQIATIESKLDMFREAISEVEALLESDTDDAQKIAAIKRLLSLSPT